MEKIAVLVDSGSDLPAELKQQYGITTLSLHISYKEKTYDDDVDITPQMIYSRFPQEIPKTSTPNLQEVKDVLDGLHQRGYTHVIAVCISSGISASYNVMSTAAKEYSGLTTFVYDSKSISIGTGFYALWAARAIQDGMSFEQVTAGLQRKQHDSKVYFYMDTLDYLRAGGRIGKVTGLISKVLFIKPIISCNDDGVYYTAAKTRGRESGLRHLLEAASKHQGANKIWLGLMNGEAAAEAGKLRGELLQLFHHGKLIVEKQIAPSMAVHTGPGLVGVGVFNAD